jgi:hypothetical protein
VRSTVIAGARSCLIGILAATLLNLPVTAAGAPSVGMIVSSDDAMLSNAAATRGVDVYPGDTLTTLSDGSLRFASGPNQIYLLESSQAVMSRAGKAIRASVNHGTVDFSGTPGQLEIQTPLGIVRGTGNDRSYGQVAIYSPTEIKVSAYEGELLVADIDGNPKKIPAGETYIATLEPAGGPTDPGILGVGRPRKINWRRVAAAAVIFGGTALITYELYNEFTESCSQINCGAK